MLHRKLDKLVKKLRNIDGEEHKLDYTVLDKAYEEFDRQEQLKSTQCKAKNKKMSRLMVCISVILVIAIATPVMLAMFGGYGKLQPDNGEPTYCLGSSLHSRGIDSIKDYNKANKLDLLYINTSGRDVYENSGVRKDPSSGSDVLIEQHIVYLDTYEEISLFISKSNYYFDFLERYDSLKNEMKIEGATVRYETVFNDKIELYTTHANVTVGKHKYRLRIDLEDELAWQSRIYAMLTN